MTRPLPVIGLMSGTSMDGIDVALLVTDGERMLLRRAALTYPYSPEQRERLREAIKAAWELWGATRKVSELGRLDILSAVEGEITRAHAEAVKHFLAHFGLRREDIALLGFHGQTVLHDPEHAVTKQIGDADLLARLTGIDVVYDFRSDDVSVGGEGAPLAPVYHRALADAAGLPRPLVVVNLGGIANITWIGRAGELLACDVGPANALLDDWARSETGEPFDRDGILARAGKADESILTELLSHPFFLKKPPKSLDRHDLPRLVPGRVSAADGAATLVAFTARAIASICPHLPEPPRSWVLCGGGARNPALVEAIARELAEPVLRAEEVGWSAEHLEAEAFAYLAVRSIRRLPLTYPGTTGAPRPWTGGRMRQAPR